MNRLLAGALLVLLATSTYAQGPIEVTTKDGRTVTLKPDGTWEFKKVAPEPAATPAEGSVKSTVPVDSLPSNFAGHDTKILYSQLLDLRHRLLKSEFETTAQYEKRVADELRKPIVGDLTIGDTFSIVASGVRADYDADSQTMQLFLPVEKSQMAELQRRIGSGRDRKTADDLSYVNLYSIQLAREHGYAKQGLFFEETNNFMLKKKDYLEGFFVEVSLGVEEARRIKSMIKALVVVRFEEPFAAGDESINRQFQVRLIDVLFFDPQTGKILSKLSHPGK